MTLRTAAIVAVLVLGSAAGSNGQEAPQAPQQAQGVSTAAHNLEQDPAFDLWTELRSMQLAAVRLPLAAALGAALAFRPRRRGTPPRSAPVIQTQIILSLVGAMVMLVVGASLARAFGIVGAASLIRYRAKVSDPKDAGVMLSTLALGLACGVGLYGIALFGTLFALGLLWLIESFEPESKRVFELTIKREGILDLRPNVEGVLRRLTRGFDLRSSSTDELCYEVQMPLQRRTDRVSNAIQNLDPDGAAAVQWEERKAK